MENPHIIAAFAKQNSFLVKDRSKEKLYAWGNEFKVTSISTSNYGDKSYYAKWTANTYTIGYELNSGTFATANPTIYTTEILPTTLNNPTRTGYTFTGWTGTEIAGTSQKVVINDCSAGNRNYTANWSTHTYTVKFDKNNENATGSMADQNFTYDVEQTLTANGFTAPIRLLFCRLGDFFQRQCCLQRYTGNSEYDSPRQCRYNALCGMGG